MTITDSEDQLADRSSAVLRGLIIDTIENAGSGHPGAALSLAPLGYALYRHVMRLNPGNSRWPNRDRLILSCGHAVALQYALLHLAGYPLPLSDLRAFRTLGSPTPGHPEAGAAPGVEATSGPLGQGLAMAVGMALAERFLASHFNRPGHAIVDHRTFVIVSDGDLMEGVSQEALSLAGHLGLDKLVACYDSNGVSIDGYTSLAFREDQEQRFRAAGWNVERVAQFNDPRVLRAALERASLADGRPSLIIVQSEIGYPSPVRGTPAAHGGTLGPAGAASTKLALGLDPDAAFAVPPDVRVHMDRRDEGARSEREWLDALDAWGRSFPELRLQWDACMTGHGVPEQVAAAVPDFLATAELAPRNAASTVLAWLEDALPTMLGGAADLVDSTKTRFPRSGYFAAGAPDRNIAFGVREHAMAAVVNGLALHGGVPKPFGSTYLTFGDYMRPAVRLSALMKLPVLWLWTHDSVAIGPDGPTHQPVEHLASLRAIPGLWTIRPCDANETAAAWQLALGRADGPVAMVLARQLLPNLPETVSVTECVARGGYVLWESAPEPDLVIAASGSEVHPALAAARTLASKQVTVRVVSLPCWELFEAQPAEYRESVLGAGVRPRLGVEAGSSLGWERWLGPRSEMIAMPGFGLSAPGPDLLEHFGFTPRHVVAAASRLLGLSEGER